MEPGSIDYVVTSFFLDSIRNPIEVIDLIKRLLKPGTGVWINLGDASTSYDPYADNPKMVSKVFRVHISGVTKCVSKFLTLSQ